MAAEPWKVLVRWWAKVAEVCCARAHGRIADVAALLESPAQVAGPQGWHHQRQRVDFDLRAASFDLAVAEAEMAACEILALGAGAEDPSNPLPSIEDLPDDHHSVRLALGMLQTAKICVDGACHSVEQCYGHVHMAYYLLGHPGLPGLYGLVEDERVAARGFIEAARWSSGVERRSRCRRRRVGD